MFRQVFCQIAQIDHWICCLFDGDLEAQTSNQYPSLPTTTQQDDRIVALQGVRADLRKHKDCRSKDCRKWKEEGQDSWRCRQDQDQQCVCILPRFGKAFSVLKVTCLGWFRSDLKFKPVLGSGFWSTPCSSRRLQRSLLLMRKLLVVCDLLQHPLSSFEVVSSATFWTDVLLFREVVENYHKRSTFDYSVVVIQYRIGRVSAHEQTILIRRVIQFGQSDFRIIRHGQQDLLRSALLESNLYNSTQVWVYCFWVALSVTGSFEKSILIDWIGWLIGFGDRNLERRSKEAYNSRYWMLSQFHQIQHGDDDGQLRCSQLSSQSNGI